MPQQDKDQKDLQQFVAHASRIVHSEQTRDAIIERLSQGEPAQALADVTLMILGRIEQAAPLSDAVKVDGAIAVMAMLGEVAEAAGIFKPTEEIFGQAAQIAIERYQGQAQGQATQPQGQGQGRQPGMPQGQMPRKGLLNGAA